MCLTDVSTNPIIPNESEQKDIVYLHNEFREEIGGKAKKIYKMVSTLKNYTYTRLFMVGLMSIRIILIYTKYLKRVFMKLYFHNYTPMCVCV